MFLWVANFWGLTAGFACLPTLSRTFIIGYICLIKNKICVFQATTCYLIKQQHAKWPQSRTHKIRAPLNPFTTINYFWFHLSPNHCDIKTHNKTRRHQSRDQNQISTQSGTVRNQSQKFPIFSSKILGLNYKASHSPKENLCH